MLITILRSSPGGGVINQRVDSVSMTPAGHTAEAVPLKQLSQRHTTGRTETSGPVEEQQLGG